MDETLDKMGKLHLEDDDTAQTSYAQDEEDFSRCFDELDEENARRPIANQRRPRSTHRGQRSRPPISQGSIPRLEDLQFDGAGGYNQPRRGAPSFNSGRDQYRPDGAYEMLSRGYNRHSSPRGGYQHFPPRGRFQHPPMRGRYPSQQYSRPGDVYEIKCKVCNQFMCLSSDYRKVGPIISNFILDISLWKKLEIRPHPEPSQFGSTNHGPVSGWFKTEKICCAYCGSDWGVTAMYDEITRYALLKITCFTLTLVPNGKPIMVEGWKKIPFSVSPVDPHEHDEYREMVFDSKKVISSAPIYDLEGAIMDTGGVVMATGVKVTFPPGAIPSGETYDIEGHSVVFCPYLVESCGQDEMLVTAAFELMAVKTLANDTNMFKRHVCIAVRHLAQNAANIKVYTGEQRNSEEMYEVCKGHDQDGQEDTNDEYFNVDDSFVYIYTKHFSVYACTEGDVAPTTPRRLNIAVYYRIREGIVNVEVYMHDSTSIVPQYIKRFRRFREDCGYKYYHDRTVEASKPIKYTDSLIMELQALTDGTSTWTCQPQVSLKQIHTADALFCYEPRTAATIAKPILAASYAIKPTTSSQDVSSTDLPI